MEIYLYSAMFFDFFFFLERISRKIRKTAAKPSPPTVKTNVLHEPGRSISKAVENMKFHYYAKQSQPKFDETLQSQPSRLEK
jgi:hypothetical protein